MKKEADMTLGTIVFEQPVFLNRKSSSHYIESKNQPDPTVPNSANCYPAEQNSPVKCLLERLSKLNLSGSVYVEKYLRHLYRLNRRPNTLRSTCNCLTLFLRFLQNTLRTSLESVNGKALSAFIEYGQDRGLSPVSIQTYLKRVCAFLEYLIEEGILHPDVLKQRFSIKTPDLLPRAMNPADVKKLLLVIKDVRNRAMILTLLRTGMRIGELLSTRVSDIDIKGKRIMIFEAHKNWAGRVVYLSDDAAQALKAWLRKKKPEKPFLFYGTTRESLSYETARGLFLKYINKAGLSHKGYTLHCLRHTFASELLNAGMRLEYLQELLGHENIEMTRRYARLTDTTRKEEYFRAMAKIEKEGVHGRYQFDNRIPKISETQKLLTCDSKGIYEYPEKFCNMGRCSD